MGYILIRKIKDFRKVYPKDKFNQLLIKIERIQWEELNLLQVVFKMLLISNNFKKLLKRIVNQQVMNKKIKLDHRQAIIQLQVFQIKWVFKIMVKQFNKKKSL
jgi:hypothetical protein